MTSASQVFSHAQDVAFAAIVVGLLILGYCTPVHPTPAFAEDPPGYAQPGPNPLDGKTDQYTPIEKAPPLEAIVGPIIKQLPDGSMLYIARQPQLLHPDNPITRCSGNVLYKEAYLIAVRLMPDETVYVVVDTNKDGKVDIVAVFFPGNDTRYADEYDVDLNYDKIPDATYTDEGHTGKCDNIKPKGEEQPETPIVPGPNYDNPPQAEISLTANSVVPLLMPCDGKKCPRGSFKLYRCVKNGNQLTGCRYVGTVKDPTVCKTRKWDNI